MSEQGATRTGTAGPDPAARAGVRTAGFLPAGGNAMVEVPPRTRADAAAPVGTVTRVGGVVGVVGVVA